MAQDIKPKRLLNFATNYLELDLEMKTKMCMLIHKKTIKKLVVQFAWMKLN
jgi:hypothetical protein